MIYLLLRVIVGPFTNVFQKKLSEKGANPIFIVTITYLFLTIILLPFQLSTSFKNINNSFWIIIFIAAVTDALGNIFLVKSLSITELSIFGPINSFKPVIAMILAFFLISEIPSINGVIGTLIIIGGSLILTYNQNKDEQREKSLRIIGLSYRLLGIFLSALGSVYVKKAIIYSTPLTSLFFWALFGLPILLIPLLTLHRKNLHENFSIFKSNKRYYLNVIILYSFMQYLTLLCFNKSPVGYSLAIFQLSSIVSIALGYKFFNEKNILIKQISAIIMIAGTVLIFI